MPMFSSSVPVAPGWWHTPRVEGPHRAAAIGADMNQQKIADYRRMQNGRQFPRLPGTRPPVARPMAPSPAPAPLTNTVTTGIQPTQLYSPGHSQRMANRAFGQAMASADPRHAQKALMGRGLSLDAGTLAAVTPAIAQGYSDALMARNVQPLQDRLANQQFLLEGQQMQGNEFLGLADLLRQIQGNQHYRQQLAIGPILSAALG